jgi:hypothetical protein
MNGPAIVKLQRRRMLSAARQGHAEPGIPWILHSKQISDQWQCTLCMAAPNRGVAHKSTHNTGAQAHPRVCDLPWQLASCPMHGMPAMPGSGTIIKRRSASSTHGMLHDRTRLHNGKKDDQRICADGNNNNNQSL